jgi:hypothetical protein
MAGPESGTWPEFRLVGIEISDDVPAPARAELERRGVPAGLIAHEYRVLGETEIVSASAGEAIVAFGSWAQSGRVCLDSASGAVVSLPVAGSIEPTLVNTDLSHFVACVAAVVDRFPFYDGDADFDDWEAVGVEIAATLKSLDDQALGLHSFWETFVDDVKIGDYATEIVTDA